MVVDLNNTTYTHKSGNPRGPKKTSDNTMLLITTEINILYEFSTS
jgi:hypothetical protein